MIRTIIVDDEQLSLIYLESKLSQFPKVQIIKKYMSIDSVLEDMDTNEFDVAFLDIEIGGADGITLAEKMLKVQPNLHIVFVSAHPQYAVKAFELDSIDYLLKPVMHSRLEKTIKRIRVKVHKQRSQTETHTGELLSICSFKEFSASINGEPLTFKTKKAKELFAFLLSHHRLPIHRDIIIDSLWPDHDYKRAKTYLHTCLSHLRRSLSEIGFTDVIIFQDECYTLHISSLKHDMEQLEDAYAHTETKTTDLNELEKSVKLYTGRYLEQNDYSWSRDRASDLQEKFMSILDELIEHYRDRSPSRALAYLQIQHKFNPYSDQVIKKSMCLLLEVGQKPEALQLYENHAELLDQDLGIVPAKELLDMYLSVK